MTLVLKDNSDPLKVIRDRYTKTRVCSAEKMYQDMLTLLAIIERQDKALSPTPRNLVSPLPGQQELATQELTPREDGEPF